MKEKTKVLNPYLSIKVFNKKTKKYETTHDSYTYPDWNKYTYERTPSRRQVYIVQSMKW